ncbi:MAG: DNA ligase D [Pseudomonadota bacterium]
MSDALKAYKAKRNFAVTSEPADGGEAAADAPIFVIQKHWASRLHYDLRLELDGTMKSWAVPKGPSYDPKDKRMAVHVEDHPIAYASFEGTIPEREYGAGKVIVWDKGTWQALDDPKQAYRDGNLKFVLHGHKMRGKWVLVRMKGRGEKQEPWLLIKEKDDFARAAAEFSVVDEFPDSVAERAPPSAAAKKTASKQTAPAQAVPKKAAPKKVAPTKAAPKQAKASFPAAAVKADLPATLAPELATLVDQPPAAPEEWIFEIKFDGYRMLARIEGKQIKLFTRNGNDWTHKLETLRAELADLMLPDGWYDGEIVVHDQNGRPNFGLLQLAFDSAGKADIVYFLFDIPYFNRHDLRAVPLEARRALLQATLGNLKTPSPAVRFSEEFGHDPHELVAAACKMGLEGVIGKRRDARYVTRRSADWIKLKCGQRQEFVIGGYTDPQGARTGIGALLLGIQGEDGLLKYAGNVGSGFNEATLRDLKARLAALETEQSPFPPKAVAGRKHHWVRPELVAEVSFAEWTNSGAVRHAVFHGLRDDKLPAQIGREAAPVAAPASTGRAAAPAPSEGKLPAGLKVSNGERVIDAASGTTKIELVRYYALVGELMMPHLKARPVSLVRAPAGVGAQLFFQKHSEVDKLPGVRQLDAALDAGHPPMLEIASEGGILSAAQWNVVEFHTQNAVAKAYQTPNRMVFDLDPGDGVEWHTMQEAAQLMHAFLDQLGLPSFLKTSGGKGLHVVVPIKPALDWDTVKDFSQAIVLHLSSTLPERFAFKSGPRNRVGKIFIDYLRNGQGATTVCAWSARARPGLGISVPLAWDELMSVKSGDQWHVRNAHTRLDRGNAPWDGFARSARALGVAMKQLGFKPAA